MKGSSKIAITLLIITTIALTGFSAQKHLQTQEQTQKINELQTEKQELQEDHETLQNEKQELETEYQNLTSDYEHLQREISELEADYQNLTQNYEELSQDHETLQTEKQELQEDYENLNTQYEDLKTELSPTTSKYQALLISGDQGFVNDIETSIHPGDGSLKIEIGDTIYNEGTIESAQTARNIADLNTQKDLKNNYDVNLNLDPADESSNIQGPSAGAAQTLTIISAAREKTLTDEILITGTIEPDGGIGKVGGIESKVKAAKNYGANKILVPEDQYVDINGITVEEVGNIEQAMEKVGLQTQEVTYPENQLNLRDFAFTTEIRDYQDYNPKTETYDTDETIEFYLEVGNFQLDQNNQGKYRMFITLTKPNGEPDQRYDNYKAYDGTIDGVEIIWFQTKLSIPNEGWTKGEYQLKITVNDDIGNKELELTKTFEVT